MTGKLKVERFEKPNTETIKFSLKACLKKKRKKKEKAKTDKIQVKIIKGKYECKKLNELETKKKLESKNGTVQKKEKNISRKESIDKNIKAFDSKKNLKFPKTK